MRKRAIHYCEVLNRIIWKVPECDFNKIATEATERLHMQYDDRPNSDSNWYIQWSKPNQRFEARRWYLRKKTLKSISRIS